MFPVLFSVGKFPVSSFGVFLTLGFILGIFLIWRLARAWDLDEEKILDLSLLTFLGGLVGARVFFGLANFSFFADNLFKIIFFTKYPGFSFWGAFLGGWLTLYFFSKRFKLDFWQIADIAAVGLLGGLILTNLGCFLGGCGDVGGITKSFLGVGVVGLLGKRWPTQIIEAFLLTVCLINIWSKATRFHLRGKIISLSLMSVGLVKIILEPLKATHNLGFLFSVALTALGITILYKVTKREIISDLKDFSKFSLGLFTKKSNRKVVLGAFRKSWYNQKTSLAWRFRNFKKLLRRFNVRFSFKNNKLY